MDEVKTEMVIKEEIMDVDIDETYWNHLSRNQTTEDSKDLVISTNTVESQEVSVNCGLLLDHDSLTLPKLLAGSSTPAKTDRQCAILGKDAQQPVPPPGQFINTGVKGDLKTQAVLCDDILNIPAGTSAAELYRRKAKVFAYLVYKHFILKKKRRFWVQPANDQHLLRTRFDKFFGKIREDPVRFADYYKMNVATFDELSAKLSNRIKARDTNLRLAIPTLEVLSAALRYLASGCNLMDLHNITKIGHSTLTGIVRKVCKTICLVLDKECYPPLTKERWLKISEKFETRANFPNCLGAFEGKSFRVAYHASTKTCNWIELFIVADTDCNILYADAASSDRECDLSVYESSSFYKKLISDSLEMPQCKLLPNTTEPEVPYIFVADQSFANCRRVLRPYSGRAKNWPKSKSIFNYRIRRAQRCAQTTLALLTNKWEIFKNPFTVSGDLPTDIVKACCILHNFILTREGHKFSDTLCMKGVSDLESVKGNVSSLRNKFANYFVSDEGRVPWQDDFV